ncbi:MAG: nucleotidyltransferase domain-containing protein [candidate division KSB1 bacterium]|nr:nucleotidyltransferase domain-containing protein [candidate division KSB1 bacterium]MDZ7365919.1 nucleotidyltransferase domain-containing protein [candidate division KSB1 bacterium]MDZ7403847.1 nucleotidyltransferase domain-containing protein [candidate division KSB1 bacterium]
MARHKKDTILEQFKAEIKSRLGAQLKQIILFGSKARGDDMAGSDYDCLAVVDDLQKTLKRSLMNWPGSFFLNIMQCSQFSPSLKAVIC